MLICTPSEKRPALWAQILPIQPGSLIDKTVSTALETGVMPVDHSRGMLITFLFLLLTEKDTSSGCLRKTLLLASCTRVHHIPR